MEVDQAIQNSIDDISLTSDQVEGNAGFECNICLDSVIQPVVTRCGHLYCWACIYEWMQVSERRNTCPVCNAACVSEKTLIPLYARGGNSDDPRAAASSACSVPVRPIYQHMNMEAEVNSFLFSEIGGTETLTNRDGLYAFLTSPLPRGAGTLQCDIKRVRRGVLYPREYYVYLKIPSEPDRLLMYAKYDTNKTFCSVYYIKLCTNSDGTFGTHDNDEILGKLKSNYVGTQFAFHDTGIALKQFATSTHPQTALRKNLGVVLYEPNYFGRKGPRKMQIAVPNVTETGEQVIWQPRSKSQEMLVQYRTGNKRNMLSLMNKPPIWSENIGAYVLNFDRRVSEASVKNFQLTTETNSLEILLQFGKFGRDLFSMDFSWPLSPLQAFAMCLSSLDKKMGCD